VWAKLPETTDERESKVRQFFDDHKQTYGSRRLSDALKKAGINAGRY
jgi:hypothetical protein